MHPSDGDGIPEPENTLLIQTYLLSELVIGYPLAGIPLGVDDPHSKSDIDKLLVDLYNGKKGATMGRGDRQPTSTDQGRLALLNYLAVLVVMVICNYICRCASRCIMISFRLPQLSMSLSQYTEIVALQRRAGSCVAFLIALGEKFFSSGVTEVDRDLIPTILSRVPSNVTSRVIPSYAMLFWFTLEVNKLS